MSVWLGVVNPVKRFGRNVCRQAGMKLTLQAKLRPTWSELSTRQLVWTLQALRVTRKAHASCRHCGLPPDPVDVCYTMFIRRGEKDKLYLLLLLLEGSCNEEWGCLPRFQN